MLQGLQDLCMLCILCIEPNSVKLNHNPKG